jgi:hypothetical protein
MAHEADKDELVAKVEALLAAADNPDAPEASRSYADLAEEIVSLFFAPQQELK